MPRRQQSNRSHHSRQQTADSAQGECSTVEHSCSAAAGSRSSTAWHGRRQARRALVSSCILRSASSPCPEPWSTQNLLTPPLQPLTPMLRTVCTAALTGLAAAAPRSLLQDQYEKSLVSVVPDVNDENSCRVKHCLPFVDFRARRSTRRSPGPSTISRSGKCPRRIPRRR